MKTRSLYPYENSSGPYRLTKDGEEIIVGTEQECWSWIHRHTSSSVEWALKYEGFRMEPVQLGELQ